MRPTPASLITLTADPIKAATKAYLAKRNAAQFETAMQKALATHHTAAFLRGTAERSAGGKVKAWLSKITGISVLSKAEKVALKAALDKQFEYLKGFTSALPDLSDAQIAARAAQYAGATQATFWQGRFPTLPNYPGDGSTPCLGHCQCAVIERDGGLYWELGGSEHCSGCQARATAWQPYRE